MASLINGQLTSGSDTPCSGVAPTAIPDSRDEKGVSPNHAQSFSKAPESDPRWFYMRVSYGQEQKVGDYLENKGIEVLLPKCKKQRTYGGEKKLVEVSLIPNVLFVHSTAEILKQYIGKAPTENLHHFYTSYRDEKGRQIGSGRRPIIIPDVQMQSFIVWLNSNNQDKIFIDTVDFEFKNNDFVRITDGEFKGFTGHVVRLKGQTRVGITLDGFGFVSTAYIPRGLLEKIK